MKIKITPLLILLSAGLLMLASCGMRQDGDTGMAMEYAKGLLITKYRDYVKVEVKNPWKSGYALDTYLLVKRGEAIPDTLPDGIIVRVPLERMIVYSDVHARVIRELGCISGVKGICDARYFKTDEVVSGLGDGIIVDCGSSVSPTVERVVGVSPDAIMLSPYQNGGYGVVDKLGVPVLKMADYMENTPLGRAEWIRFIGLLFDKEMQADSIFSEVKKRYLSLKDLAGSVSVRPKVISETMTSGVWYLPGGASYKAAMYADAAADYPWADDKSSGSLALDFPQVLDKAENADIWLVTSYGKELTARDFLDIYVHNDRFAAYKNKGVYFVNSAEAEMFEETPFHPDLLLKEYIKLFHPELLPDYELRYYKPLKY